MTVEAPVKSPEITETITPIKPSEAYKLGRMIAPRWTNTSHYNGAKSACAIGAVALGAGIISFGHKDSLQRRYQEWVDIRGRVADLLAHAGNVKYECKCHHNYSVSDPAMYVMEHYSDHHRRTLGRDVKIGEFLKKYAD